ncbi:hypothetical protein [Pantoea sp. KPR_PJ]|uniref:hypothetical protein n=1 Tax=Pantoea sp. KPR_PJ TaxID=2738375 RepID=UPI0035284065
MSKPSSELSRWQQWLRFSAFTLAGMSFEGSVPPQVKAAPAAHAAQKATDPAR